MVILNASNSEAPDSFLVIYALLLFISPLHQALPPSIDGGNYGSHALLKFRNTPLLVAAGCGLPTPGFTLIADETVAGELFSVLASKVEHGVLLGPYSLSLHWSAPLYIQN